MQRKISYLFTLLLFVACNKENTTQLAPQSTSEVSNYQSPDDIPLNDLGTGLYRGYVGGLYPGGANQASGVYAEDLLTTSNSIKPIDINGNPDATKGFIVFISMGGSTGGKNMKALISKTKGNPIKNPTLPMVIPCWTLCILCQERY